MKTYYHIIFTDLDQDWGLEQFFYGDMTEEQLIEYLSKWDFGEESEHTPQTEPSHGTADDIYDDGAGYLLSWNTGLGYVGLDRYEETGKLGDI